MTRVAAVVAALVLLLTTTTLAVEVVTVPMRGREQPHRLGRRAGRSETIPIAGCPGRDFIVSASIGIGSAATSYELIVDTGSSTLAVAGSQCTTCGGVTPTYDTATHVAAGAVSQDYTASSTYESGATWTGGMYQDTVAIDTITVTSMSIVEITTASTGSNAFFGGDCNNNNPSQNQGILGMAFYLNAELANQNTNVRTDTFPDKVEQIATGDGPGDGAGQPDSFVFSMIMCKTTGSLTFNGYDDSLAISGSTPYYVPLVSNEYYYEVTLTGLSFTNDQLGSSTYETVVSTSDGPTVFLSTVVDSGSTNLILPTTVKDDVNTLVNDNTYYQNSVKLGQDFLVSSSCTPLADLSVTLEDINNNMPWLRLDFTDGFAVVLPPVSSYFQLTSIDGNDYICPGIGDGGSSTTILGIMFMTNFLTIFDRTNVHFSEGAIGLIPTTQCDTGFTSTLLLNGEVYSGGQTFNPGGSAASTTLPFTSTMAILVGALMLFLPEILFSSFVY